jgi:hypothetical protein
VKFLGLKLPAAPAAPGPAEVGAAPATPPVAPAAPHLSAEDHERFAKMHGDLRWLVSEGYVMEFMDGRLFSPPPMAEARKQEVETSDNDPENFPEGPAQGPEPPVAAPAGATAEARKVLEPLAVADAPGEATPAQTPEARAEPGTAAVDAPAAPAAS